MEYLVGILLSLATVVFAAVIGLDREQSFYSTVLFVIATYYVLFAVMGTSPANLNDRNRSSERLHSFCRTWF